MVFESDYQEAAGQTSADFHAAVGGRGPTVTFIEVRVPGSEVWQVIGGHHSLNWSSADRFRLTPDDRDRFAFISAWTQGLPGELGSTRRLMCRLNSDSCCDVNWRSDITVTPLLRH